MSPLQSSHLWYVIHRCSAFKDQKVMVGRKLELGLDQLDYATHVPHHEDTHVMAGIIRHRK